MKRIILLVLAFISIKLSAQKYQPATLYGKEETRFHPTMLLGLPNDTFAIPTAKQGYPHAAIKGGQLYVWNTTLLKWEVYAAGSGTVSIVDSAWTKFGNSGTDPLNNWVGTNDPISFGGKVNSRWAFFHRYVQVGDSTPNSAPGGGFMTNGMYSGQWLIDNLVNGGSTISGYTSIYSGFNVAPRAGLILPGDYAGAARTDENVFYGYMTGRWTRIRSQAYSKGRNVGVSYFGFFRNISGSYNSFLGPFALELNNAGNGNSAFNDALRSNIDGDFNSGFGGSNMTFNSTGVYSFTIVSGGIDYAVGDTIYVSAPTSNGPGTCLGTAYGIVTAVDGLGTITATSVHNPGCGYSEDGGCFYVGNCHPAVTVTSISGPGTGTGASLTPVLRSGSYNSGIGVLGGAFNILSQYNFYGGYQAGGITTRYWDDNIMYLGTSTKIPVSVPATTPITTAIAFGREAEVEESNTAAMGSTTYPYKWVINGPIGDSALKVNGGVNITSGLRVQALNQSIASSYVIPVMTSNGTFINSGLTFDVTASTYIFRNDDNIRGTVSTNHSLGIFRNKYPGDATSNVQPMLQVITNDSGATQKYFIKGVQRGAPTGGTVITGFYYGRSEALRNAYLESFVYDANNGVSNYQKEEFHGVNNMRRVYGNGNYTFGGTADPGLKFEVVGDARITDSTYLPAAPLVTSKTGRKVALIDDATGLIEKIHPDSIGSSGPGGSGDVVGPGSATDNAFAVFDGTTGKLIKDGVFGTLSTSTKRMLLANTTSAGNILIGEESSGYGGMWFGQGSPGSANYGFLGSTNLTAFNVNDGGTGVMSFRYGNATMAEMTDYRWAFGYGSAVTSNTTVTIRPSASNYIGLRIQGIASQSGDLLQFNNNGGTVLGNVNSDGHLGIGITASSSYRAKIKSDATVTRNLLLDTDESYPEWLSFNSAFGQNAYFTGTFKGIQFVLPLTDGNYSIARGAVVIQSYDLDNGTYFGRRMQKKQGADVASAAGAITLGGDGNAFEITGTAAITLISNVNWQNGSEVVLVFTSTATLTDGTANSGTDIGIELAGNTNFSATAGATIRLALLEVGGTQRWREIARSVN